MKFEQLLQIYWSRNFLYGGKTESFNITFKEFFNNKPGLSLIAVKYFIKRFELNYLSLKKNKNKTFLTISSLIQSV